MRVTGKIIGFLAGLFLFGPVGALIGLFIGHQADKQSTFSFHDHGNTQTDHQHVFSELTFSIMGYVAKADGRVSENEIRVARAVMAHIGLNPLQQKQAIDAFSRGKSPAFNLYAALDELRSAFGRKQNLLRMFIEIQIQAVYANHTASPVHQRLLQDICRHLGLPPLNFNLLDRMYGSHAGGYRQYNTHEQHNQHAHYDHHPSLDDCYAVLGIDANTSKTEAKRAYRKLMSQHHPDKLVSKGLPEEMIKLATEKTQRIQKAYDRLCAAKAW